MKKKLSNGFLFAVFAGSVSAQGLYDVGVEAEDNLPLKWAVGGNLIYDDNVSPGGATEEDSFAINPFVGATLVSVNPQTTWDINARIGLIYYFDTPTTGMDEANSQSRVSATFIHQISERLRVSSRNTMAYELEPNYSYGYATSRQLGAYFTWRTDNSVGYRWTQRFATVTGFRVTGTNYMDVDDNDRLSWEIYNQLRYQLKPQTVLTADYRFSQTYGDGLASDAQSHYIIGGAEHRFNATTSGVLGAGIQIRNSDDGSTRTSPYLELALNSKVTQQMGVKAFTRYGIEDYDTVLNHEDPAIGSVEFDDRRTLRFGVTSDYAISPTLSVFGGLDYIPTSYKEGRSVSSPPFIGNISDLEESLVNVYIGVSVKFNDFITGTATYNYTDSSSDVEGRSYDRNRISVGVTAEF